MNISLDFVWTVIIWLQLSRLIAMRAAGWSIVDGSPLHGSQDLSWFRKDGQRVSNKTTVKDRISKVITFRL